MTTRQKVGMLRRAVARSLGGPQKAPKEQLAAQFFIDNFGTMTVSQVDTLVERLWKEYRRLDEIQHITGLSLDDDALRIIDVGGGFTTVARLFSTPLKWVIDICADELRKAGLALRPDIHYINGSALQIPFPGDFFDVVFCTNAFDHFEDPAAALAEMKRVLKQSGHAVVAVDVFASEQRRKPGILHPHAFTEPEVRQLLAKELRIVSELRQPAGGKVGFAQLAAGNVVPKGSKEEVIFVLKKTEI